MTFNGLNGGEAGGDACKKNTLPVIIGRTGATNGKNMKYLCNEISKPQGGAVSRPHISKKNLTTMKVRTSL